MSMLTSIWERPWCWDAGQLELSQQLVVSGHLPLALVDLLHLHLGLAISGGGNTWDFLVGMVFLLISLVNTPLRVSMPRDRGHVQQKDISHVTSETPPWIAAPNGHSSSSGLTDLLGCGRRSLQVSCTLGILDMPPTRMTSPMSDLLTSASFMALWQGSTVFLIRSPTMSRTWL